MLVGLETKMPSAASDEANRGPAFVEPAAEQDQAGFEIVLVIWKLQRRVEPKLAVGKLPSQLPYALEDGPDWSGARHEPHVVGTSRGCERVAFADLSRQRLVAIRDLGHEHRVRGALGRFVHGKPHAGPEHRARNLARSDVT